MPNWIARSNRVRSCQAEHRAAPQTDQIRDAGGQVIEMKKRLDLFGRKNEKHAHHRENDRVEQEQISEQRKFHRASFMQSTPYPHSTEETSGKKDAQRDRHEPGQNQHDLADRDEHASKRVQNGS